MSRIKKAVIPAAGSGTRMKPISNYLPKPMLPLGKKPVLQYIIEELKGADIEEIAIVTRSEYETIFEYFSSDSSVTFIEDNSSSGPGGAILKAENFIGEDDFIVIFSDAPMLGKNRSEYLKHLIAAKTYSELKSVLSIYPISKSEISSRGVVCFEKEQISEEEIVRLTDILEKPSEDQEFRLWASACRYIFEASIIKELKAVEIDSNGERQLTPAIRKLIEEGSPVGGLPLKDDLERHDTGNFEGYFEAFRKFSHD